MKHNLLLLLLLPCLALAQKPIRAAEGGGDAIDIDTITPLKELITRLEHWEWVETYKGYYIGYADDMFSIAAYGDKAIPLLEKFIKKAKTYQAKSGGLLTLHLLGLNSVTTGHMRETFINAKARQALLTFLDDTELQPLITKLLRRDPWPSDLPYLVGILKHKKEDCWPVVNLLFRYNLKNLPLQQEIPEDVAKMEIHLPDKEANNFNLDYEAYTHKVLERIGQKAGDRIIIEEKLLTDSLFGTSGSDFRIISNIPNSNPDIIAIGELLNRMTRVNFIDGGYRLQYFIEDNTVYICSPATAKQRLVKYWDALPDSDKKKFKE